MRNESEKKNKKTFVTMTYEDFNTIDQKAKKAGMGVSPYMVDKSLHCDNVLTPEKKAKIQNFVNLACRAVEENALEKIKELQKEVSEIWLW